MPSRVERLAYLDRAIAFWAAALALDERGAACCRAKLADLADQRARLLAGQPEDPAHGLKGKANGYEGPNQSDV